MKNFLRQLLGIQTWQILLVNPASVDTRDISQAIEHMPIKIILTRKVDTLKFIDTHILAIRKGGENNGRTTENSSGI